MEAPIFQAGDRIFPLDRVYVMGILNVTPDSFSDGGRYFQPEAAVARAVEMAREGADIIDIGGQSNRPGFTAISPEEEWARIAPVVAPVAAAGLTVSVDTFYPEVARKALAAGAKIINDVSGFGDEMLRAVADSGCGCVVMFPEGGGGQDVCEAARAFFADRLHRAAALGIAKERLCFDPGIGFGKTYAENLRLIARVERCRLPGSAFLMAASRKRVVGAPCGDPPFAERLPATLAAHTAAILGGADMVRVHDVKEAVQAAKMARCLREAAGNLPE